MNPSRSPIPATATPSTPTLFWEPVRLLLAGIGGLVAIAICYCFLGEEESGLFATFLQGQTGFEGMWSSALFWKCATAFAAGAGAGYFVFLEIPASLLKKANSLALAVALFIIPVVVYIPAMSAGFLWDDDQEISANPSLRHAPPDANHPREFTTNWYGLWEIWTGGITNEKDGDAERAELGKDPAPLAIRLLRPPLCWLEKKIWGGDGDYRFRANPSADYFPLKTTLLWVEYQLWGHDYDQLHRPFAIAPPFHVMNILMHALDGLLLWMVLRQLKVPGAWLGSLLFAIHPVHAESVAWIAERKNTLSLFFCLLSVSEWLRFEDSEKRRHYIRALLLFLAALLCKTHVVVFPAVLMLMTWWRTGHIPGATPALALFQASRKGEPLSWGDLKRDCARFGPFFAIALTLAWMTVWFQNDRAIGGEVIPIGDWPSRIAGSGVVIWSYLSKAILPINLNTIYANTPWLWWPLKDPQPWMFLTVALVPMLFLTLLAIRELYPSRSPVVSRTPFFVFAYFVGTLFPVLGWFTMSYMRLTLQADHFQYFSDISIVAAAGALIALCYEKAGERRPLLVSACVVLVFSFCAYSWERAGVHLSEKTLWTACLKRNEASWQAHNHIGAVLYAEQKVKEAAPHFARAVELKPENPEVHNNLGLVLWRFGNREAAIAQYREAVRIKGEVIMLRANLVGALMEMKRFDEAIEQFKIMLKETPNDPNLHANLGIAYAQLKRFPEARQEFEIGMKLDPNNPSLRQNYELLRKMAP